MEKEELKEFILNKIYDIHEFKKSDYLKVVKILKEIKLEYLSFIEKEKPPLVKKKVFIIDQLDEEIRCLENEFSAYLKDNFFQTKLLLKSIISSLEIEI